MMGFVIGIAYYCTRIVLFVYDESMKRKIVLLSLAAILLIAAVNDPRLSIFSIWDNLRNQGIHGMQVKMEDGFNLIICNTERTCLHEVGHTVDQSLGNISASPEFEDAILALNTQEFRDANPRLWERLFWYLPPVEDTPDMWAEYYANLYADWRMGLELPDNIAQFFLPTPPASGKYRIGDIPH